jgi:hypothetical protein
MGVPTALRRKARRLAPGPRRDRGQALVELALVLPFLILLLLGLVEVGHGFNSYLTVVSSSRDAARLGAQGANDVALISLVVTETERLDGVVPGSCGETGVCITRSGSGANASVTVRVCYNHDLIVGVPGLLSGPLKMCSTTKMRVPEGV